MTKCLIHREISLLLFQINIANFYIRFHYRRLKMSPAPEALVFEIVKKNHCFLQKRNGRTNRSGRISFSTEPGNLKNIHSSKFSGISKDRTIDISAGPTMTLKVAKKASNPSKAKRVVPMNSKNFRKSIATIAALTEKVHYRSDLADIANARYAKLYSASQYSSGVKTAPEVKAGRNSSE